MIRGVYNEAQRAALADELADAFLTAQWKATTVAESGAARLDRWPSWMEGLALAVVAVFRVPPVGRRVDLAGLIQMFLAEHAEPEGQPEPPRILGRVVAAHDARVAALRRARDRGWAITEIESVAALAERLELSDGQLAWLADTRGLERTVPAERLRNYRYRTVPRRNGLPRLIEAPKARLKEIQRWVLHEILDHVPAHEAAHGFRRGRSAVSHAQLHTGQRVVLRLDLTDFFASIAARRVYGIFLTLGYPPHVAHVLTGLSTNTIPQAVWLAAPKATEPWLLQRQFWLGRQLATPHLPQGAPTSPALANLAAFRLDRRLSGLATASGLRYSRYADDLTFSGRGRSRRGHNRFEEIAAGIARQEGFELNRGKSAVQAAGARQSVCGVVVNVHTNVARTEYDQLKAILHNAARHGPASQNRSGTDDLRAHLRGRIAWVASLNPDRGEKLRQRFAEIDWSRPSDEAGSDH